MPVKLNNFWQELKRRKVVRVVTVYAAAAFVIIELTNNITEPLHLPEWVPTLVIVLLAIGFLISIVMSWVYDITPEGLQKTKPSTKDGADAKQHASIGWKISTYTSILIIIAFVLFYFINSIKKSSEISKLEKSIAVLPFENWNSDEEFAYLGDAITDEIILQLQYINEFDRVLSRSSTMQYKDNRPSITEIGEELGVNYIVEGSIQRQGDDVKIRIQVIRANPEDHIWGDKFDDKWGNILSLQDEIAFEVAHELKAILSPGEIEQIRKIPTEDIEAYNHYLQGRYCIMTHAKNGYLLGIKHFEKAINIDNNYALAYIWLAHCYKELSRAWNYSPELGYKKAKELLEQSIKIDETIGEAHAMLAFIRFASDWEMSKPDIEFKKALELSPRSIDIYFLYAQYLMWTDRIDQAIITITRAIEIDPFYPQSNLYLGVIYFYGNRYDESIIQLKNTLEIEPLYYYWANVYLAHNYTMNGMYDEANYYADKVSYADDNVILAAIAADYVRSGRQEDAQLILERLLKLSNVDSIDPTLIASIYAGLDKKDEAFKWLNKGYEDRSGLMIYLKVYSRTFLKELSPDPRFKELLEKVGFEVE